MCERERETERQRERIEKARREERWKSMAKKRVYDAPVWNKKEQINSEKKKRVSVRNIKMTK